jgi:hypothetical protein
MRPVFLFQINLSPLSLVSHFNCGARPEGRTPYPSIEDAVITADPGFMRRCIQMFVRISAFGFQGRTRVPASILSVLGRAKCGVKSDLDYSASIAS